MPGGAQAARTARRSSATLKVAKTTRRTGKFRATINLGERANLTITAARARAPGRSSRPPAARRRRRAHDHAEAEAQRPRLPAQGRDADGDRQGPLRRRQRHVAQRHGEAALATMCCSMGRAGRRRSRRPPGPAEVGGCRRKIREDSQCPLARGSDELGRCGARNSSARSRAAGADGRGAGDGGAQRGRRARGRRLVGGGRRVVGRGDRRGIRARRVPRPAGQAPAGAAHLAPARTQGAHGCSTGSRRSPTCRYRGSSSRARTRRSPGRPRCPGSGRRST